MRERREKVDKSKDTTRPVRRIDWTQSQTEMDEARQFVGDAMSTSIWNTQHLGRDSVPVSTRTEDDLQLFEFHVAHHGGLEQGA